MEEDSKHSKKLACAKLTRLEQDRMGLESELKEKTSTIEELKKRISDLEEIYEERLIVKKIDITS